MQRYHTLDGCRGLCAVLVVLHHFMAVSHISEWALIKNAWIFVDFFFVLSGFVMAGSYAGKLAGGFETERFILLRLGRLYPLHLFMFLAFVAFELLLYVPALGALSDDLPFSREDRSWMAVMANLTLTHRWVADLNGFNGPSWSIAVELFAYIVFCLAIKQTFFKKDYALALVAGFAAVGLFFLSGIDLRPDHPPFTLFRGIFGFIIGVFCYQMAQRHTLRLTPVMAGGLDVVIVMLVAACVLMADDFQYSLAIPLVFALVVYAFSFERGLLAGVLKTPPFLLAGTLSYSIYMVHLFLQQRLLNGFQLVDKVAGTSFIIQKDGTNVVGRTLWEGDLITAFMLALVFAVAYMTYRWVEKPCLDWTRRRLS